MHRDSNGDVSLDFEYSEEFFNMVNDLEQNLKNQRMEPVKYDIWKKTPTHGPHVLKDEVEDRPVQVSVTGLASLEWLEELDDIHNPYEFQSQLMELSEDSEDNHSVMGEMTMPVSDEGPEISVASLEVGHTDYVDQELDNLDPYVEVLTHIVEDSLGGSTYGVSFYTLSSGEGSTLAEAMADFNSGTEVGLSANDTDRYLVKEDGTYSLKSV